MELWSERIEQGDGITLIVLRGDPSPEEWNVVLDDTAAWLNDLERRGLRTCVVIDSSDLRVPGTTARRIFGEWRAQHMPLITNVCRCAAYVAASPVMRGVLVAVFWIARPVVPVEIVGTRDSGLNWVREFAQRQP